MMDIRIETDGGVSYGGVGIFCQTSGDSRFDFGRCQVNEYE